MNQTNGNLRPFESMPAWIELARPFLNGMQPVAETAFGTVICTDASGMAWLFWPSELRLEEMGVSWEEMLETVTSDPSLMLDQELYEAAIAHLGVPTDTQHLSWKVPPEAGGELDVANLEIIAAADDLERQIAWGRELSNIPAGTKLKVDFR